MTRTTRTIALSNRTPAASRRHFLKACAATGLGLLTSSAQAAFFREPARTLSFYQTHTSERLRICYWENGSYHLDALEEIDYILRDHRTDEVYTMDQNLYDLLFYLQQEVDIGGEYHILSGYRCPATNAMLQSQTRGVATHSLHMAGQAIDIRLPGCSLRHLHRAALSLQAGGVGYYPYANFIHVDTGRVRTW